MNDKYRRDGTPYTGTFEEQLFAWAKDFQDFLQGRRVALEKLPNGWTVSTVWLGLDQDFSWTGDTPNPHPLIFETMSFTPESDDCVRTSTEAEALAAHLEMVEQTYNKMLAQKLIERQP